MSDSGDTQDRETAVIVLLEDEAEASYVANRLLHALVDSGAPATRVLTPAVRGAAFFLDDDAAESLDEWWVSHGLSDTDNVFVLRYSPELEGALDGVDGTVVVAVESDVRTAVDLGSGPRVLAVSGTDCVTIADAIEATGLLWGAWQDGQAYPLANVDDAAQPRPGRIPSDMLQEEPMVDPTEVARERMRQAAASLPRPAQSLSPLDRLVVEDTSRLLPRRRASLDDTSDATTPPVPMARAREVDLPPSSLTRRTTIGAVTPSGGSVPSPSGPLPALRDALRGRRQRASIDAMTARAAELLAERKPFVVGLVSRKGGVGKTAHAAGVAIRAGFLCERLGATAAFVDANIGNPDAWDVFGVPDAAATVRSVVNARMANLTPPEPVWARDVPCLAIYPESREPGEYTKTEIDVFVEYLLERHALVVVDHTNRLPGQDSAEGASVDFWLDHMDAAAIPVRADGPALRGCLDYLNIDRPLPPVVVPYIVPGKLLRRDPEVQRRLQVVADAVAARNQRGGFSTPQAIFHMPEDLRATQAVFHGVPAEALSPQLRAAYSALIELLLAVGRSPQNRIPPFTDVAIPPAQ